MMIPTTRVGSAVLAVLMALGPFALHADNASSPGTHADALHAAASSPATHADALHTAASSPATRADAPVATILDIDGAIGPATARYVVRGLETAQLNRSRIVVLRLDTPGGLDASMRDIIRAILASPVPVVSYVAPPGARAASAGTYILYASHIAAMAPATNLGAATPVSIGGESPSSPDGGRQPEPTPEAGAATGDQPSGENTSVDGTTSPATGTSSPATGTSGTKARGRERAAAPAAPASAAAQRKPEPSAASPPGSALERKVVNDAVAYIRGLAELRGRNADWAEQAVRGAASLSASAALRQGVVDVIARDLPDLLRQIDGREVRVDNRTVKLSTRGLALAYLKPDWRTRLLSVITHPTVAYGLLLLGIYGLLFEGYNPGAALPGVVGAISLLIALFAFQILSVNYAGLALVALGVAMIVAEFFFPAFGSLGLGGLVAFVVGSLILFDTDVPGMNIGLPVIAAVATAGGLVILAMAWVASRSLRRPVVTGAQAMVGGRAEAFEDFTARGRIRYGGEIWNAHSNTPIKSGQIVRIVRVEGLTLWIEPV